LKFNLNVEVTDDELKEYASDVLLKVLGAAWRNMEGAFADPQAAAFAMNLFQQGMQAATQAAQSAMQQRKRAPMTGPQIGYVSPAGYSPPGPYGPAPPGPYGPGASPYGTPPGANGANGPSTMRPIQSEGAIDRCFPIEATRYIEAGIACHVCATYNGVQRTQCRHCGHVLCHGAPPIVTPPPEPARSLGEA